MSADEDELLVAKWLLIGGYVWHAAEDRRANDDWRYWVIQPGRDEYSPNANGAHASTVAAAIRKYIKTYPDTEEARCLKLALSRDTTASCRGPT